MRLACAVLMATCLGSVLPPCFGAEAQRIAWPMPYDASMPGLLAADDLLDAPAGKRGRVEIRDGHLYTGDRRLRLWGVNVCFSGIFATHAEADFIADRLARFGVNAVRFHGIDRGVFPAGVFADEKWETLSPEALERLDYFIARLKERGIYSNINLQVTRRWSRVHKWEDAEKLNVFDKILNLFHPELIAAQKRFATDLLTHKNPYTGLRYADDPAVCMVEIINEDTFFRWDGQQVLRNLPPAYGKILDGLWNRWLAEKYPDRRQLEQAWGAGGLADSEDPSAATVLRWGRTSSKSAARVQDWHDFLQTTEQRYFLDMLRHLKEEVGVQAPITGTFAFGPLGAYTQSHFELVDSHAYFDHPKYIGGADFTTDKWTVLNVPQASRPDGSALHRLAVMRAEGKPFTVSEFNHCAPNEYAADAIPMVASFASLHDWDGVFLYSYKESGPLAKDRVWGFFGLEGNPTKMGLMSLGSRLFLGDAMRDQRNAPPLVVEMPRRLLLQGTARYYYQMNELMTHVRGVPWQDVIQSPFSVRFSDHPAELPPVRTPQPGQPRLPIRWTVEQGAGAYVAGAGPDLKDSAWVFAGSPKALSLPTGYLHSLDMPFASIMVVPAPDSEGRRRWLISACGRVDNPDMVWDEARRTVTEWGKGPARIEAVHGVLRFPSSVKIDLRALTPSGEAGAAVPAAPAGAWQLFDLSTAPSLWYEASEVR